MRVLIRRIKNGLKKRKVKVFIFFLLLSTLAWSLSNLSRLYVSNTAFTIKYSNSLNGYLLSDTPKKKIEVRLKAVGFQFIAFQLREKFVALDISKTMTDGSNFFIPPEVYKKQIRNQLPESMEVIEMETDTIFLDFAELIVKEVSVITDIKISLPKNYTLDEKIGIDPETVLLKGPKSEIDTILSINAAPLEIKGVTTDFSFKRKLQVPAALKNTSVSPKDITVSGIAYKFSEKLIQVPITILNIPKNINVRTFPNEINILSQGDITLLKKLTEKDFTVEADYAKITGDTGNKLRVVLTKFPDSLGNAKLMTNEVEFIIRRSL